jgi:hypothetical protein
MKKTLSILTAWALMTLGAQAMGVGGFYSYLDSEDLDDGSGFGVKLVTRLLPALNLELRGNWLEFDTVDITAAEAALTLGTALGELRPYVGAGAGYHFFDADAGDPDDAMGWFVLAGGALEISPKLLLFGEARWLLLEADWDDAVDELEDVDIDELSADGFGVNAGLLLYW